MRPHARSRRGALLLIISGISAIVVVTGLAFVMRMRADAAESLVGVKHAQCRTMLMAGLQYILEAGRIGWENVAAVTPPVPSR